MSKSKKESHKCTKLHVKKGDKVVVLAGDDKGKVSEILEVDYNTYRAVVDGVNMVKKHQKPAGENPGGIVDKPASIHLSNLALVDPSSNGATRIGRKLENGKRLRYSKKSGEIIK